MSETPKFASLDLKARKLHEHYKQAMSEAHKKIANNWRGQGENVQIELLFPNDKSKANAYSVDLCLPDYLTLIEIDGKQHLDMVKRDNIRDTHIMSIALGTGVEWRLVRVPLDIPVELLYGHLEGNKRELTKAKYLVWLNELATNTLQQVKRDFKNRQRLQNLKSK